jgi:excisionase family DNA binding protein
MILTVSDAARLFAVSEQKIYGWIREREIPFARVNEQYRFHRQELLEWATRRHLHVALGGVGETSLERALERGGVHADLAASDRASALASMVQKLPVPAEPDRALVLEMLRARVTLERPGRDAPAAIPEVRAPIVLDVPAPCASLFHFATPIPLRAGSAALSSAFLFVTPTVRAHEDLVALVAAALRDDGFVAAVKSRAGKDDLLAHARRVDAAVASRVEA